MDRWGVSCLSMLIVVSSYLGISGTEMTIIENLSLAHADFKLYAEWDPLSKVVDINSTALYSFYARSKISSFTLNASTGTNISLSYSNLKVSTEWNFTVVAFIDGRVIAKGSKDFQLQRIDNISLTNVDFDYLLRWNPVTVFDEKIGKAVRYNVSAKAANAHYYHFTTTNTTLSIFPALDHDKRRWMFVIVASIDSSLVGISETKEYSILARSVPTSFSAPLLNLSNDCGATTVNVSLKRRFDDMIMRLPDFKVEYFYDNSTTPFNTMSKLVEYVPIGPIDWTSTVQTSRVQRVCVVATYSIFYGGRYIVSDRSMMCAIPQCRKDDQLLAPDFPMYFNVLIGVAIVAAVILLTLLIYNLKKYVWNPWKGKKAKLPVTTKHVIEYHPDDHAFSKDWHQGELLSKVEPEEVTNLVNLETETPLCSCDEREIAFEIDACDSPTKRECMTLNTGDHHIENPIYEKTYDDKPSRISSEKNESFSGLKESRKDSVDSAFSEYISLQVCQSTAIVSSPPSDIPTLFNSDEGYVRFPGENR